MGKWHSFLFLKNEPVKVYSWCKKYIKKILEHLNWEINLSAMMPEHAGVMLFIAIYNVVEKVLKLNFWLEIKKQYLPNDVISMTYFLFLYTVDSQYKLGQCLARWFYSRIWLLIKLFKTIKSWQIWSKLRKNILRYSLIHSVLAFMVCTPIILIMMYVSISLSNTSLYKTRIQQVVCTQVDLIWKENESKLPLREMSVFRVFLVRIFPHSDWIRRDTEYIFVFSPNAGKYGPEQRPIRKLFTYPSVFSLNAWKYRPEKLRVRTLFTQFTLCKKFIYLNSFTFLQQKEWRS